VLHRQTVVGKLDCMYQFSDLYQKLTAILYWLPDIEKFADSFGNLDSLETRY